MKGVATGLPAMAVDDVAGEGREVMHRDTEKKRYIFAFFKKIF
jgi:hypothetical protein